MDKLRIVDVNELDSSAHPVSYADFHAPMNFSLWK